jgi:hypothetical protein
MTLTRESYYALGKRVIARNEINYAQLRVKFGYQQNLKLPRDITRKHELGRNIKNSVQKIIRFDTVPERKPVIW